MVNPNEINPDIHAPEPILVIVEWLSSDQCHELDDAGLIAGLGRRLAGCSSHSGRRTFITNAARQVHKVGGSLRDVQQLAGHSSLTMTQRYIEGRSQAKRALVNLL